MHRCLARSSILMVLMAVALLSVGAGAAEYKETFPKIAGMYIGGPHNYQDPVVQEGLARHDLVIVNFWRGWSRGGKSIGDVVREIKARNPSVLIGLYTDVHQLSTDPGEVSKADIRFKLSRETGPNGVGDWWARDADGNQVSPNISSNARSGAINITRFVEPDANGDRYPEWLAKRHSELFFKPVPEFDIWYSDNVHYKPRTSADWNGDGINDSPDDPAVAAWIREGHVRYWEAIQKLHPEILIMGNVDGNSSLGVGRLREPEYKGKLPAAFFEAAMGKSYSEERWSTWETMMESYRSLMDNTASPHLVVLNVAGAPTDYAFMRYGLASALMEDGYFSYTNIETNYAARPEAILWFDEFDLDLGKPIDGPQRTPWKNGIYKREFENGLVLVNPKGNGTQTVTIEPGFKRFLGTQDPVVNNGEPVTEITLPERDGIILVRE